MVRVRQVWCNVPGNHPRSPTGEVLTDPRLIYQGYTTPQQSGFTNTELKQRKPSPNQRRPMSINRFFRITDEESEVEHRSRSKSRKQRTPPTPSEKLNDNKKQLKLSDSIKGNRQENRENQGDGSNDKDT